MPHTCLTSEISKSKNGRYRHQLLKEKVDKRGTILVLLRKICAMAHADFIRHFRGIAEISLDPLQPVHNDPCQGYPEKLHLHTLKGYFGEIFAGVIAENFSPLGEKDWRVPVHLFRFHLPAFHQLQQLRESGAEAGIIPGRQGDDCLAFKRNAEGQITHSLVCEAKCTSDHHSGMVSAAHEKLNSRPVKPVDILQLIDALKDYNDSESQEWVESLRQFYLARQTKEYETCDMVSYVCGRTPRRNRSWISTDTPHARYTAKRRLEAVEVHFSDVDQLIKKIYHKT